MQVSQHQGSEESQRSKGERVKGVVQRSSGMELVVEGQRPPVPAQHQGLEVRGPDWPAKGACTKA